PQIRAFWQVAFAYSSNALEGSTLTESETKVILEEGLTVSGKPLREHMEALGHRDALTYLFTVYQQGYTEATIRELHQLFFHRINQGEAGRYRRENVLITGTDYLPPKHEQVPALMAKFGSSHSPGLHPIERAGLAHMELVNIHPFIDGNGRTARLLMNLILLRAAYPIALIPPIFRARYIETTKAGNKGDSMPFLSLLSQVAEQSLRDYLRLLEGLGS
ncbi:MAG: Fic family protein, partial [Proteobacteria bacterium]|nr:Fic family protein [Pseudomonadota bacterium]